MNLYRQNLGENNYNNDNNNNSNNNNNNNNNNNKKKKKKIKQNVSPLHLGPVASNYL